MNEWSKWRAEIIEKAINIEWLINAIICQNYMKKLCKNFLFEVLYDEYFSFALKRLILEKIIPNRDSPETKQKIQQINRLNTIRNYFAHGDRGKYET